MTEPTEPSQPSEASREKPSERAPRPESTTGDPTENRRGFFGHAMREAMMPVASLLEKKINPLLNALEQLPQDVEGTVNSLAALPPPRRPLDQPQNLDLDVASSVPAPALTPERFLRPPGAGDDFATLCSRCGKCVEVCPADAIKLNERADRLPYIIATQMPCVMCDSLSCMNQCPSGALKLLDKFHIDMGTAKVTHATCLRTRGEACELCVNACPLGEAAITVSNATGRIHVKVQGCTGCGLCEQSCPTEPRSIIVHPAWERIEPMIS